MIGLIEPFEGTYWATISTCRHQSVHLMAMSLKTL